MKEYDPTLLSFPFTFPSKGALYNGQIPEGEVKLLPILGVQEEQIAGSGEDNAIVMALHLTESLIQLPNNFKFSDLLVTDWLAAYFEIMAHSYSPEMTLNPKCPHCGRTDIQTIRIGDLPVTYPEDISENYCEPFQTKPLPLSKEVVTFRILRIHDMRKIHEYEMQVSRKPGQGGRSRTFSLAQQIISIDETQNIHPFELEKWVRTRIGRDLASLRAQFKAKETGYDFEPEFVCRSQNCNAKYRVMLPIMEKSFFRSDDPQA